ncbi:efflux RND transporter periplasmic adaptor subunit [Leeuwenhoekiella parthenopeia]|uniref:Efflux RND transporter periplasmic adaptor subunit n=1 Tax=Leeuwenhoekiella parthenopeia TaxID=2890320 RepID=A0ABS8GYF3_9FLAO|nr:efflux RND transporter periplasmic adaptor subunit [Leeuwenhoekiella parthenopeia]MCC4213608.1 efflux RND transporter periplasmic adaptor subunit [Leeuwenhoekiella parthenopeia]
MKNLSKYTVISLLAILLGLTSCGDSKSELAENNEGNSETEEAHAEGKAEEVMLTAKQFDALQMQIDTLQMRNMSGYVEANGQLEVPPQNEASITTVVGANVVSIEVIEGDKVNKGQTVAYLSHPNIIQKQTDYLNAYSNSQFLKKEFERQKTLYDAGVGSGANFQKAEAEYQASRSMAKGLEAQLQQLNVSASGVRNGTIYQRVALRSPIEGFVQKVEVKTGQYVEPQTDLMEIVDTHHVHADLMVFEKDVYKVKEGQKVTFNVQSIPGKELTAEIYSVGKTFEQNPKAIHVHAEIENKEGNLIPGMYIQGRIQTDNSKTLAIPESAIAADGNRFFVFSVEKEGDDWSFTPNEVTKGSQDGEWIPIDFLTEQKSNVKYALNNAYYLMAEMKKGEAEHSH